MQGSVKPGCNLSTRSQLSIKTHSVDFWQSTTYVTFNIGALDSKLEVARAWGHGGPPVESITPCNPSHHASESQRMTLDGVNLLEKLLMTTAAPAIRYMSMIIGGLCHKSA